MLGVCGQGHRGGASTFTVSRLRRTRSLVGFTHDAVTCSEVPIFLYVNSAWVTTYWG